MAEGTEKKSENNQCNDAPLNFKYKDDFSMFMAWQNYCWMSYSYALYQESTKSYMREFVMQQNNNIMLSRLRNSSFPPQQAQQQNSQQGTVNQESQRIRVKLASLQNRVAAELIDFLLLAFIKVLVIFICYGDEYLEHFNFVLVIDDSTSFDDIQWMLLQALLFRAIVVGYEGYMLSGTLPFSHGHTLGKSVMGITVLYCINFEERNEAEQTVQVMPEPLGVGRSFLRSLLKNMSISILFPMLLPILMFSHNRLVYDMAVGSVVVDRPDLQQQRPIFDFR